MTLHEAAADLRKSLAGDPNVLGVTPFGTGLLLAFVRKLDAKIPVSHEGFTVRQHEAVSR